jgi:hypothetical protein
MLMHRDPETGQFLSHDETSFDDIEVATFRAQQGVEASNLSGATGFSGGDSFGFSGQEIIDYDDIVDRNEELRLLSAYHALDVWVNSTETADGTVRAQLTVSASPSRTLASTVGTNTVDGDVVGAEEMDDSIDFIGPIMTAVGTGPFSDGGSGVGGGGSAGEDRWQGHRFPVELGRFHPRDELFCNGYIDVWNIDDAGVHVDITGQHVYGVLDD